MSLRQAVLWDTSAIIATLNARDDRHALALEAIRRMTRERRPAFTTNYVEAEAHGLLVTRIGRGIANHWLRQAPIPAVRATPVDERRARELLDQYADKDFSLCDAISFAVMDSHGCRRAFSFDRHFRQYGRFEVYGA